MARRGTIIADCYNANQVDERPPRELPDTATCSGRRSAVLGEMHEPGPREPPFRAELGSAAGAAEVGVLMTVGLLTAIVDPGPRYVVVIAGKSYDQAQGLARGQKILLDDMTMAREILRGDPVGAAS